MCFIIKMHTSRSFSMQPSHLIYLCVIKTLQPNHPQNGSILTTMAGFSFAGGYKLPKGCIPANAY